MKKISWNAWVILAVAFAVATVMFAVKEVRDAYGPVAEFDSVQEVADNITEFYSIILDRQDITEGEFVLDVYPGKKIVVYGTSTHVSREYTIEGERKVRQDGDKAFVTKDAGESFVELSFAESFEAVTSTLYVQYGGEEIALPINVGILPTTNTLSGDAGTEVVQQIRGLDDDGSYEYVLSVGSDVDMFETGARPMYLIAESVVYDSGAVKIGWMWLQNIQTVTDEVGQRISGYQGIIVNDIFFDIAREDERYQDILTNLDLDNFYVRDQGRILRQAVSDCKMYADDAYGDTTRCTLVAEAANIHDSLKERAEQFAKDTDEYKRVEAFTRMSRQERIAEIVEHIVFTVVAEVESVDGVDVTG